VKAAYHVPWSLAEVGRSFSAFEEWLDESDEMIRAKLKELIFGRASVGRSPFASESSAKDARRAVPQLTSGNDEDRASREMESRVATAPLPEHR
jgi:hypothetical protein